MLDIKSISDIVFGLSLLVPGLVIVFVREQFVTGRASTNPQAFLRYIAISAVYYLLVLFSIDEIGIEGSILSKPLAWLVVILFIPAVLGALLGYWAQKQCASRLAGLLNVYMVQAAPTAWDWKFAGAEEQWVLVTLKDGSQYAGFLGADSFVSSDLNEQDIYIEKVYNLGERNVWIDCGSKGVLIGADQVKSIEFWPEQPGEATDG